MKKCIKCGIEKPRNLFYKYAKNADGLFSYCSACACQLSHKRQIETRAKVAELKSKPCVDCGGIFPSECMDFDHLSDDKIIDISKSLYRSMEFIKKEIAKCDLVCANCHRIRTYKRGQYKGKGR
jgi:hypothetical protein